MEHKEIAYAISEFLGENTMFSPIGLAEYLDNKGCVIREKAKLVAPTYIQGRKFDKIFHCTACNGIPYGGVGEDSHFCMVCGAEIEEIVGL
jgi:hypothetical protein